VRWEATVSGSTAQGVYFFVDGSQRSAEGSAPYCYAGDATCAIDTAALAKGSHTFRVESRDSAGNVLATNIATATVENVQSVSDSNVLAYTRFEPNLYLSPTVTSAFNQYQWPSGTDLSTALNFGAGTDAGGQLRSFSGSRVGVINVVCSASGTCPGTGAPSDYMLGSLKTMAGPTGASTRALALEVFRDNPNSCCDQIGFNSTDFGAYTREFYMRAWWKFNPDLQAQANSLGSNYWRAVWAFKTKTDQRIDIKLYNNHAGGVTWHLRSDDTGANCNPCNQNAYWDVDTTIKAPTDRWFPVEIYYRRAADNTGRFLFAADGKVVLDRNNLPNTGRNPDEWIAVGSHAGVYGSYKSSGAHYVDNFELRDKPPCSALPCGVPQ
jgi:hypothetical protein